MARTKYPISREFAPFDRFTPPMNHAFVALAQWGMREPRFFRRDPELTVETHRIAGYQGGEIAVHVVSPRGLASPAPCFVNFHGGGFVFEGYNSHYRLAMTYAKEAQCRVAYVQYRLAPKHPFPVPQEDCFAALCWVHDHAEELGVDRSRIGVGGDSAGGSLTVAACMMARERGHGVRPLFQLLIYPWLDGRNASESFRRFTDTPMWNSTLSAKVGPIINPNPDALPLRYRSPVEADGHDGTPTTWVEVAEFDCLHDDGVLYASLLREAGVEAELHEVRGAMHGFDTVLNAPTTQRMVEKRIDFMRRMFAAGDARGDSERM